jgi:2-polyprenyl-3-methyl-5-hydroxy-6-metoxy-1,4-benzoquinol methylase
MARCRICDTSPAVQIYSQQSPAVTSTGTTIDVPTTVYLCEACGHGQSEDLQDVRAFYDTEYRISAASDEHDQLYEMVEARPVYRTDKQAEVALAFLDLPSGARVLDFGCAKATTLKKILKARPDVDVHAFDVSGSYRVYWQTWLKPDRCATHDIPDAWLGRFDAVTAHFVLEHVIDPVGLLRSIGTLLKPEGRLFLSVPDVIANPGDLVVVDHLNHFTSASLAEALRRADLAVKRVDCQAFAAALVFVAGRASAGVSLQVAKRSDREIKNIAQFWRSAAARLKALAASEPSTPTAIFGAGFYGVWIASVLAHLLPVVCFVDNNPHVRETRPLGIPVLAPKDLPKDVRLLCVGLNPLRARAIVAASPEFARHDLKLIYLD